MLYILFVCVEKGFPNSNLAEMFFNIESSADGIGFIDLWQENMTIQFIFY